MIKPSQAIAFYFGVQTPSTGAAVNADSTPTVVVYKNGAVDVAVTPTVTNPATGSYKVAFTAPSGYAAGDIVEALVTATVATVVSPPTSVFLDSVDTKRVGELNDITVAAIWNALTATLTTANSIGKRLVDFVTTLVYAAPLTPTQTENAVWDATQASHVAVGSTGLSLSNAGSGASSPTVGAIADAVWDEAIAGHLNVGSTGASLNNLVPGQPIEMTVDITEILICD